MTYLETQEGHPMAESDAPQICSPADALTSNYTPAMQAGPGTIANPHQAWEGLGADASAYRAFLADLDKNADYRAQIDAWIQADADAEYESVDDCLSSIRRWVSGRIVACEEALPVIRPLLESKASSNRGLHLVADATGDWATGLAFRCPECRNLVHVKFSGDDGNAFDAISFEHDDYRHYEACATNRDDGYMNNWFLQWLGLGAFLQGDNSTLDLDFLDDEDGTTVSEPDWLIPGMFARGDYWSLFGPSEVGKSLLALDWALRMARRGQRVLYLDRENAKELIQTRLKKMGAKRSDFANLIIMPFVEIKDLATPAGATELHAMVAKNSATVVILDTISKFSEVGQAVQSDRWQKIYNHSFVPLLNKGVSIGQLDHTGLSDKTRERDSNAKRDNVSVAWALTWRGKDKLTLTRAKNRPNYSTPGSVAVQRLDEPILTHEFGQSVPDDIRRALDELDRLNVPARAGRPAARAALEAAGVSIADKVLEQAIRLRKTA